MESNEIIENTHQQKSTALEGFECPITRQIMAEPVTLDTYPYDNDESTYEKEAIEEWLSNNDTNPHSGVKLQSKKLKINTTMKRLITEFLTKNPEYYDKNAVYLPKSWASQLIAAIKSNEINTVNLLLAKDPRLLTIRLEEKYTAFHLAAQFGSLELTRSLFKKLLEKKKIHTETILNKPQDFKPIYLNALLKQTSQEKESETFSLLLKLGAEIEESKAENLNPQTNNTLFQFEKSKQNNKQPDLNEITSSVNHLNNAFQNNSEPLCIERLSNEFMAAGLIDGNIQILDQKSGLLITSLSGHTGPITCLRYIELQNISLLISASADNHIRFWKMYLPSDLNSNLKTISTCERTLHKHTNPVLYLKILSNNCLASCSADNTAMIWRIPTGDWIQTLGENQQGHKAAVTYIEQLSTNELITCSVDNTSIIWTENGQYIRTFQGHKAAVNCVVEINENTIATASIDGTILIWYKNSEYFVKTLEPSYNTGAVTCLLLWSKNLLMSGSSDSLIRVWNIENAQCIYTLKGHTGTISSLQKLTSGDEDDESEPVLLSCSDTKEVKLWAGPTFEEQLSKRNGIQQKKH